MFVQRGVWNCVKPRWSDYGQNYRIKPLNELMSSQSRRVQRYAAALCYMMLTKVWKHNTGLCAQWPTKVTATVYFGIIRTHTKKEKDAQINSSTHILCFIQEVNTSDCSLGSRWATHSVVAGSVDNVNLLEVPIQEVPAYGQDVTAAAVVLLHRHRLRQPRAGHWCASAGRRGDKETKML